MVIADKDGATKDPAVPAAPAQDGQPNTRDHLSDTDVYKAHRECHNNCEVSAQSRFQNLLVVDSLAAGLVIAFAQSMSGHWAATVVGIAICLIGASNTWLWMQVCLRVRDTAKAHFDQAHAMEITFADRGSISQDGLPYHVANSSITRATSGRIGRILHTQIVMKVTCWSFIVLWIFILAGLALGAFGRTSSSTVGMSVITVINSGKQ